jgi:hypothetical protein
MQDSEKRHVYGYIKRTDAPQAVPYADTTGDDVPMNDEDDIYAERVALPQHKTTPVLLIGLVGGVISALIPLAITLANAGVYQQGVREGNNMSLAVASTITTLSCLDSLIAMVICGLTGFVVGKIAVRRMLAFYAGAITGALYFIIPTLLQYIPGFPGHITGTVKLSLTVNGILIDLVLLLGSAVLGALLALLGGYIATSKHPYYHASYARRDQDE